MAVKVVMTWNIQENHVQEYFDFLVREFVPKMNRYGIELSDAWSTVYGERPQVMLCAVLPDVMEAERRLAVPEWQALTDKLQDYISDFQMKIVPAKTGFQF